MISLSEPSEDGIAVMTLQRPEKRNALSIALRDAMSDALDELAADELVKVVIVTGAGDVFSAGFDLREFEDPAIADELWASSDRWHRTIVAFPLVLIAAVNGPALAGGFDLAMMCDIRVAADTARFAHPEHGFSQVVYGPLHDAVGGALARELAFTGRVVEAVEAREIRLVSAVVPVGDVLDAALQVAVQVALAPRDVIVQMKSKAVRRAGISGATLDL